MPPPEMILWLDPGTFIFGTTSSKLVLHTRREAQYHNRRHNAWARKCPPSCRCTQASHDKLFDDHQFIQERICHCHCSYEFTSFSSNDVIRDAVFSPLDTINSSSTLSSIAVVSRVSLLAISISSSGMSCFFDIKLSPLLALTASLAALPLAVSKTKTANTANANSDANAASPPETSQLGSMDNTPTPASPAATAMESTTSPIPATASPDAPAMASAVASPNNASSAPDIAP
mmetsp:Transcript_4888/g.12267  ORF Transcript_4888/g.12267 Transcript_4888/m.12267 type:complete len:232 (-) Transcript_4888:978-1673(-)